MEDNWFYSKKLHTYRYEILFKGIEALDVYKNKKVLELAPFMGWFSEELNKQAKQLDLIELHPKALEHLAQLFNQEIKDKKVNLFDADIHHQLYRLEPIYNFISCCGFLYHTPHPFWILEGIANLKPEYVLMDTHCSHQDVYLKDAGPVNQYGMRQSRQPAVPYNTVISEEVLMNSMKKMGYELYLKVDKAHADVTHLNLPQEFIDLFSRWKKDSFSAWFKKST